VEIFRQIGNSRSAGRILEADREIPIPRQKSSGRWGKPHRQAEIFR